MRRLRLACLTAALALCSGAAFAIDYRSVSEPAILFDAPSSQGKRLFIIAAGTPVEVVVVLDKWVKVRDQGGAISWIEGRKLSAQRTVLVNVAQATARRSPDSAAPAAFEAVKDVVLELVQPPVNGWVSVRHRDGASGFLRVTEVWGL
jgi:SH3-like domain-containing protein